MNNAIADRNVNEFKTMTNLGIGGGVLTMFLGSGIAQQGPGSIMPGFIVTLAGWGAVIWGSVNYMRWKGHSGWFALFAYLLLPGLVVLACFSNRRKRLLQEEGPEQIAARETMAAADRKSGLRYLLTLAPLGLMVFTSSSVQSEISASEWQDFSPPEIGFRVLMPGTPRLEQKTEKAPAGDVILSKFLVEPKGKKELFMIVRIGFPEAVARQIGDQEKLLQIAKEDLVAACQGRIQSEKPINLGGILGLELEILPAQGAIVKSRVFATANEIYQVTAHVPIIRVTSQDVDKYLNSFRLPSKEAVAPK